MSQGRHIFLSYRSTEAEFALKLAASLKNEGVNLWMDRLDIDPGDDWRKELGNALNSASAVIAILSPGYVASKYCQRELARADRLARLIFPILLGPNGEEDWPLEIERQQYIDFSQWQDQTEYTTSLHRLVDILKDRLAENFDLPTAETQYLTNLAVELESQRGITEYLERGRGGGVASDDGVRPERRFAKSWAASTNFTLVEYDLTINGMAHTLPISGYKTFAKDIDTIIDQYPRFVLIGEPGSGKTTALHHLVLDAIHAHPLDAAHTSLPLLINLADWDDRVDLKDFIASHWTLESDPFKLMSEGEVVLYLDGLSEISSQRTHKVSTLRQWLSSSRGPRRVIVTCRKHDYSLDLNLGLPVVQIGDMLPAHIQRFASSYLADSATAVFLGRVLPQDTWSERDKHTLFDLARNPFSLSALLLVHKALPKDEIPANKGALLSQLTAQMWQLTSADGSLSQVSFGELEQSLSQLAHTMIEDDMGVYVPYKVALQVLGSEAHLQAAHHANFIQIRRDKVRFTYQAQQDTFAAKVLLDTPAEVARPQLDEWGGVIEGKWDRAQVIQCCLTDKPNQAVLNIAKVNPFLALNCIAAGVDISDSTIDPIIGKILHFASSPKKDVRVAIASILAHLAPELALPILVEAMRSGTWQMRSSATRALWELDARLLESLTQAMQDLDKVEDAALTAIRRLQDDALPTLIKLLRSEDRKVRRSASWALGELRDQAAAPGLVQMLYDADAMVSEEAGRALGLIRDEATIPWLIETLRHSNVRVRKSAARALGLIGESALKPLLEVMRDGNEMLSCLVAEALKEIRLPVVTEILLDLTRATSDEVRCAALEALDARRDPLVIQRLIECLADETMIPTGNKRICDVAARGLENIDTAEARNALEEWKMRQEIMFSQEDGKRGKTASTAKHRLKHITRPRTEPLPPLSDEIETATKPAAESHLAAPTPSLQPSAAPKSPEPAPVAPSQPIKRIKPVSPQQPTPVASKGEAPLDILNDLIANIKQDSAWGEREDVAKTLRKYTGTLGEYDTLNVVKRLEQELRDPDWVVRWATTEAMASVGNVQAVPALMSMVHDSNWTVRIAVVRSLLELGEASATEALLTLVNDKQSLVREAVAEALGVLRGPNAFTGVANLASDSEVFVRLAAVHTLHDLEDAGAENLALAALDDEDAHIRWEAASVLGKIGTAAAVDKLALYLHDREGPYWENLKVCDLAALALEHIGTPKALALLEHWRSQQADRTQGV